MDTGKVTYNGACSHIEGLLNNLEDGRSKLDNLWAGRRMKLELCLQLRQFERDALEVSSVVLSSSEKKQEGEIF